MNVPVGTDYLRRAMRCWWQRDGAPYYRWESLWLGLVAPWGSGEHAWPPVDLTIPPSREVTVWKRNEDGLIQERWYLFTL